jgi:hypothetical protein
MTEEAVPGWTGMVRADGVRIKRGLGGWVIVPRDARCENTQACPYCTTQPETPHAARVLANNLYPLAGREEG